MCLSTKDDSIDFVSIADPANNMAFDPCSVYTVLDNDWRRTESRFYSSYGGYDDTLVEWSGWYRLYLQGKSAQIPESDWCWSSMACGGYTPLLLGGSHPRPQDGIVPREIYGSYGTQCYYYRSNPIQVKACPGNYYVYRLVKPAVSVPMPAYCAGKVCRFLYGLFYNDLCRWNKQCYKAKKLFFFIQKRNDKCVIDIESSPNSR